MSEINLYEQFNQETGLDATENKSAYTAWLQEKLLAKHKEELEIDKANAEFDLINKVEDFDINGY